MQAGVEAGEGGEDGEAVVPVDEVAADALHGDHHVLQVGHLHAGQPGHGAQPVEAGLVRDLEAAGSGGGEPIRDEYRGHVFSYPPITAHLLGRLSTLPPPESWVRTPGVERDRGSDMARGARGDNTGWQHRDQAGVYRSGRGAAECRRTSARHQEVLLAGPGGGPGASRSQLAATAAHLLSPGRGEAGEVAAWLHLTCLARGEKDEI